MRRAWCALTSVVLLIGCGGGAGGPAVPVNGIVTMDGAPLAAATITFHPDESTVKAGGTGGFAKTGTDGKFVVLGSKGQQGLAPGQYKVTVSKGKFYEEPPVGAITESDTKDDLPPKYSSPAHTKLAYTIIGDGKPIEIKLTSK